MLLSMTLTVHSQVTFSAPAARNTVTTWRQAATKTAGEVCWFPQEYQLPFISWPNDKTTWPRTP